MTWFELSYACIQLSPACWAISKWKEGASRTISLWEVRNQSRGHKQRSSRWWAREKWAEANWRKQDPSQGAAAAQHCLIFTPRESKSAATRYDFSVQARSQIYVKSLHFKNVGNSFKLKTNSGMGQTTPLGQIQQTHCPFVISELTRRRLQRVRDERKAAL